MDKQDKFNFGYHGGDSPYYDPDVQAGKRERYWHDELRKMGNRQTTSAGAPVSSPPSRIESPAEAAKAGAAGFAILAFLVTLIVPNALGFGQIAMVVIVAAGAGAVAGMALYAMAMILAVALKVVLGLLGVGVVLHLLGLINLFAVGRRLLS